MALHIKDDGTGKNRILTEKEFQNEKDTESAFELAGAFSKITLPVGIIAGIIMFIYMAYSGFSDMNNSFEVFLYVFICILCSVMAGVAAYMFFIPFVGIVVLTLIFTISDKIFFDTQKNSDIRPSIVEDASKNSQTLENPRVNNNDSRYAEDAKGIEVGEEKLRHSSKSPELDQGQAVSNNNSAPTNYPSSGAVQSDYCKDLLQKNLYAWVSECSKQ
jgi:hypothetical protein